MEKIDLLTLFFNEKHVSRQKKVNNLLINWFILAKNLKITSSYLSC